MKYEIFTMNYVFLAFIDVPEVIEHMKYNYDYWKDLERQGVQNGVYMESYVANNPPPYPSTGSSRVSHL